MNLSISIINPTHNCKLHYILGGGISSNLMKYFYIPVTAFIALSCWLNVALAEDAADETIWMPDPNLRAKVRETLKLADGTPLTPQAMQGLSELVASRPYWNRTGGVKSFISQG